MDAKRFDLLAEEVQKHFPIRPKLLTKDVCEFFGCKDKGFWHRLFHKIIFARQEFGMTNTKEGKIWINPHFVRFGDEQSVKNVLAHEFNHLNREGLVGDYRQQKTQTLIDLIEKNKQIIMELERMRIHEEVICNKKAMELYPVNLKKRNNIGLKVYFLHPRFLLELAGTFLAGYIMFLLTLILNPVQVSGSLVMLTFVLFLLFMKMLRR